MKQTEIRRKFETYVRAWESGQAGLLDEVMTVSPFIRTSILGDFYSRETFKVRLEESYKKVKLSGFRIHNFTCRADNQQAVQSAYITGLSRNEEDKECEDYQFAGLFINRFIREADVWKISDSSFDLMDDNTLSGKFDEEGRYHKEKNNKKFAAPEWKLIWDDVEVYDGCRLPAICGELQAPWLVVHAQDVSSDMEILEDYCYRIAFAFDMATVAVILDILGDSVEFELPVIGEMQKTEGIKAFKKIKNVIGSRGVHLVSAPEIQINTESTTAQIKFSVKKITGEKYNGVITAEKENEKWSVNSIKIK